ncbi:CHAT domain-containing protein, partial [Moorena sp. SIO3I6]|uniref:CHAT domain-containing protein n=1 Tax=Moorena sp. SIO3I6 TaxID=2607831 RepID=UPI0013F9678E
NALIANKLKLNSGDRFNLSTDDIYDKIMGLNLFSYASFGFKLGQDTNKIIPILHLVEHSNAEQTFHEAEQLYIQNTIDSKTQALVKYKKVLHLIRESGGRSREIDWSTLSNTSLISEIRAWLYTDSIKPISEKYVLTRIADIYRFIGEFQEAINYYYQARSIFRVEGDMHEEATVLMLIASIYDDLGAYQQARNHYEQILSVLLADLKNLEEKLASRNQEPRNPFENLVQLFLDQRSDALFRGESAETESQFVQKPAKPLPSQQALQIIQSWEEDRVLQQRDLVLLDQLLFSAGGDLSFAKPQKAIENLNALFQVFQNSNTKGREAATLTLLAKAYNQIGEKQQAIEYYQQAFKQWRTVGFDLEDLGESFLWLNSITSNSLSNKKIELLIQIGQIYYQLGKHEQSLNYLQQVLLSAATVPPNDEYELQALLLIAQSYKDVGKLQEFFEYLNMTISLSQAKENPSREAASLFLAASVSANLLNEPQQTLDYLNQAKPILEEVEDTFLKAVFLFGLAMWSYNASKQPQEAIKYLNQALPLLKEAKKYSEEISALLFRGIFYEELGDTAKAIASYKDAIEVIESIRADIKIDELKASFASQQLNGNGVTDPYTSIINLLWKQGDKGSFEEAYKYVERLKARSFIDQLANGRFNFREGANSKSLQREQNLRTEMSFLSKQLNELRKPIKIQWDLKTIADLEKQLVERQKEYENLLIEIKSTNPEVANLISVDVASLSEIQALLDSETTLVEYFVQSDRVLAFIITKNSFNTVTLNVTQAKLINELTLFRYFPNPYQDDLHPEELKNLHQWLIEPLKPYLNTSKIGFVPHSILHYLPFAALTDGERYLSDDYALFTLPNASILSFLPNKRKLATSSLLALGDPVTDLPPLVHARGEVKKIANLFNTEALVREKATESIIKSRAEQAEVLHIAAHGEYNRNNPLFSTIYLTEDSEDDGQLQVREIYEELDLTQATNLVVLSACNSKIGQLSRGDEIIGLNRALLYAGTPTVMASLWSVNDEATGLLMESFYKYLQTGMNKAEALQQAQIEVRKQYPHPYFWAAFSLTGDPSPLHQRSPINNLSVNNLRLGKSEDLRQSPLRNITF